MMSITVQWDNPEKTVVHWDFDGKWDWSMYREAQQQSRTLVSSVQHTVTIVADMRHSPSLPNNAMGYYARLQRDLPDNTGLIVLVGASAFVRSMVTVFGKLHQVAGSGFAFADTLEEARSLIAESLRDTND